MVRAFVAIAIDAAILDRIFGAVDVLVPQIAGVRWTPKNNAHLTLKFLGEVDERRVEPAIGALRSALSPFPCFAINAKGLGVFPDASRPRVLWVGIRGEPLAALFEKIETALYPLGFGRETRTFQPHLTIARWRQFKRSTESLKAALTEWRDRDFGSFTVREVVLLQSILGGGGAEYRRLSSMRLSGS